MMRRGQWSPPQTIPATLGQRLAPITQERSPLFWKRCYMPSTIPFVELSSIRTAPGRLTASRASGGPSATRPLSITPGICLGFFPPILWNGLRPTPTTKGTSALTHWLTEGKHRPRGREHLLSTLTQTIPQRRRAQIGLLSTRRYRAQRRRSLTLKSSPLENRGFLRQPSKSSPLLRPLKQGPTIPHVSFLIRRSAQLKRTKSSGSTTSFLRIRLLITPRSGRLSGDRSKASEVGNHTSLLQESRCLGPKLTKLFEIIWSKSNGLRSPGLTSLQRS